MNTEEQAYLDLMKDILENGEDREDRTSTGTKSIFGAKLKFSLKNNTLPLITTKKVFFRGIVEELLFFIRGETDSKILEEKGINIWKGNTSREFLDKRNLFDYKEGEMGPMYGYQWRNFDGVDQLKNCFDLIKNDPKSRRIMVTAYNPADSSKSVLDPCHIFYQFYVTNNNELSCQWYQRSCDTFMGFVFNCASYALLTHLMAMATGLKAKELIFIGGDVHLYKSHFNQTKEQIKRKPYDFPTIEIKKTISSIDDMEKLNFNDFSLKNYKHHDAIKANMSI